MIGVFCAVQAVAAPPAQFGEPELLTFDNGLRVVLQPDANAANVSVVARIDTGWNDDPDDRPGLAHLVEHLWFRRVVDEADVWSATGRRGCLLHATTSADTTRYEGRCGAKDADFLIQQTIAGVGEPLAGVDEAATALEVSIVDQELRERADAGMEVVRAVYRGLQPKNHPVHGLLAPPDFDAPALSLAQAKSWVDAQYTPTNTVLAVVGGFDRTSARQALEAAFGSPTTAPAAPSERSAQVGRPPEAAHQTDPLNIAGASPLPAVVLGWNLPPALGRSMTLGLTAEHLGQRLAQELADDSVVVDSQCGLQAWEGAPSLVCTVRVQPDTPLDDDLDDRLDRAVRRAWDTDGRKALRRRLLRARAEAPQDLLFRHTRPLTRARRFAEQVHYGGVATTVEAEIKQVRRWKPQAVVGVAPQWFSPDRAARVRLTPDPDAAAEAVRPWRGAQMLARTDTPVHDGVHPVRGVLDHRPAVQIRALPTGLTVVGIQHPSARYVMASVRIPGGTGRGPPGLVSTAESLTAGSRRYEAWGVRTGHRVGRDYAEVYAIAPQGQVVRAVEAARYGVMMRVPVVDADENGDDDLDRHVRRLKALDAAGRTTAAWRADMALLQATTPGHQPSLPLIDEDFAAMQSIDSNALLAYLWRAYQPAGAVVLVSGPQPPEKLVRIAARQFGRWTGRQGIIAAPYASAAPAGDPVPIEAIADDGTTALGWVTWRCRLPATPPPAERMVLRTALNMATFDELRHRRGWAYTPSVQLSHWPDGTATMQVSVAGPADLAGEVVTTLDGLPGQVAARLPAARDRTGRALVHRLDSLEGYESLMVLATGDGRPPTDPVRSLLQRVDAVSEAQIAQTMEACRSTRSFVARGPAASLRPSLEAAGFTPTMLDAP